MCKDLPETLLLDVCPIWIAEWYHNSLDGSWLIIITVIFPTVDFLFLPVLHLLTEDLLIEIGTFFIDQANLQLRAPPASSCAGIRGIWHHTQFCNCYFYYYISSYCLSKFSPHYKTQIKKNIILTYLPQVATSPLVLVSSSMKWKNWTGRPLQCLPAPVLF